MIKNGSISTPRIALLFCGGTIGMVTDPKTGALQPAKTGRDLLEMIPGLDEKVSIDVHHLFNMDSSSMTPVEWSKIAETIHEHYDDYDGFVIAQGTDTMAYSASAVSYVLQNLGKPVVFTGSIVPMTELGADGRNNLIYACLVATLNLAEVCIVFGNKIIRAVRSKKNHESFVDVFHSPSFPLLGEIERPIRLCDWTTKRHAGALTYKPGFDSRVMRVTIFPGFSAEVLTALIERDDVCGLLLEGFGPGNLPAGESSLLPSLQRAQELKKPVMVASQMEKSQVNLHAYQAGFQALEYGVVSAGDMTSEAALTKLMWALAQSDDYAIVCRLLETAVAGEMSVDSVE
jgi:L-asparaginase